MLGLYNFYSKSYLDLGAFVSLFFIFILLLFCETLNFPEFPEFVD